MATIVTLGENSSILPIPALLVIAALQETDMRHRSSSSPLTVIIDQ